MIIKLIPSEPKNIRAEFTVRTEHTDIDKKLDFGFLSFLITALSNHALIMNKQYFGSTKNLSVQCFKPSFPGEKLTIEARTVGIISDSVAQMEAEITDKDGELVASGQSTINMKDARFLVPIQEPKEEPEY